MPHIPLYSFRTNEVQEKAGLNWGFSKGNVRTGDAYLALSRYFFQENPNFFEQGITRVNNKNTIHSIWDDGEEMILLLEGTQQIGDKIFPKQISTYNDKSRLGLYLRARLGVNNDYKIKRDDLKEYGRESIEVEFDKSRKAFLFNFSGYQF